MTSKEARDILAATVTSIHQHVPAGSSRTRLLGWLHNLAAALHSPAQLCSDEELFDGVMCRDAELLTDLARQLDPSVLVQLATAALTEQTERSRRVREDLDLEGLPLDPSEAP